MKSHMNLRSDVIGLLVFELCPLIAGKKYLFYFFILKFTDKVDMDRISEEFETWLNQIICLRLKSP